jgi:nucleotide-binding universal stress UspA family protein
MTTKILAPIAFSKYSKGIINFAASLAEPLGAELLIVNVINERDIEAVERIAHFGYKVETGHYVKIIQEERRQLLAELTASLTLPDEQVSFSFLIGEPATELLKIVVEENIDMVVMGMRTKEISQIFTGSVAERLFRRCPCTIVSYRDNETCNRLRKRIDRH